jgi:hypothetical protein
MQYVRSPTATVGYGMCLGMGGFLLACGGEKVGGRCCWVGRRRGGGRVRRGARFAPVVVCLHMKRNIRRCAPTLT